MHVWWRPQKTVRHAKTALLFHRAQSAKYALHCAQYAKCTGLNRRWNDLKTQQNLLFVKVFISRIKFPCKSMAFSNFSYNTLFNATSVKPRLCALSMQKGRCGSWEKLRASEKSSRKFDGRIFGSRLCVAHVKTAYECTSFSR